MNIIVLLIVLLILFGGGGFYAGGPSYGLSGVGLVIVVLVLLWAFGVLR